MYINHSSLSGWQFSVVLALTFSTSAVMGSYMASDCQLKLNPRKIRQEIGLSWVQTWPTCLGSERFTRWPVTENIINFQIRLTFFSTSCRRNFLLFSSGQTAYNFRMAGSLKNLFLPTAKFKLKTAGLKELMVSCRLSLSKGIRTQEEIFSAWFHF